MGIRGSRAEQRGERGGPCCRRGGGGTRSQRVGPGTRAGGSKTVPGDAAALEERRHWATVLCPRGTDGLAHSRNTNTHVLPFQPDNLLASMPAALRPARPAGLDTRRPNTLGSLQGLRGPGGQGGREGPGHSSHPPGQRGRWPNPRPEPSQCAPRLSASPTVPSFLSAPSSGAAIWHPAHPACLGTLTPASW